MLATLRRCWTHRITQGAALRSVQSATPHFGLEEFFEPVLKEGEKRTAGRAWEARDLRNKSWEDLHKLWYVLLKERNLLASEKLKYKQAGQRLPNPTRVTKVRKSMTRLKTVLYERALAQPDAGVQQQLKDFVNAL